MEKIIRLSKPLAWLCKIGMVLLPAMLIVFWIFASPMTQNPNPLIQADKASAGIAMTFSQHLPAIGDPVLGFQFAPPLHLKMLSAWQRFLGALLGTFSMGFTLFILYFLKKLFTLYSKGDIFSKEHVKCFKHIGLTLIVAQFCKPIFDGLTILVFTWNNTPRLMTLSFGNNNIYGLLAGTVILLIALIMQEGYKIKEEIQLTV